MKNIKRYRMKNYRIFVEKHPRFRVEAESLRRELNANLNLDIRELRLLNVYDLFGFSEELLEKTRYSVFGEVVTDSVTDACDLAGQKYIAVEYLPGQFDQRAASAVDCVRLIDPSAEVQVYGGQLGARDGYYFPYVVEERLTQSLRAGDAKAVEDVLSLLQTENFVRRSLNRSRMRQLNRRIVEILSAQTGVIVEENADLMALNELAFDYKGDCEPYFERLNTLCQALCSEVTQQKNARRSENVKAIEEYIRKNYHNPNLGLAMVSAEFNLSEGYLSAIFKKETGTNFAEYLEQLRVKEIGRASCRERV